MNYWWKLNIMILTGAGLQPIHQEESKTLMDDTVIDR